ncbi:MAG: peptide deformylase [Helicobacteraceae bacterium]|jgi:peptide deformylase|nr:peptide deformylase [Helicobacteraceae bacterium]
MRKILVYPDRRLRQKSKPVTEFDVKLHGLLDDMRFIMLQAGGVGFAAVQVGEPICAFIVNLPDEKGDQTEEGWREFINPKIVEAEGEMIYSEGCLSIPEYNEEVARFQRIVVEFYDRDGCPRREEASGLYAVVIQHEYDHLEGRLFVERLSLLKRKKFEKEWKKTRKN